MEVRIQPLLSVDMDGMQTGHYTDGFTEPLVGEG